MRKMNLVEVVKQLGDHEYQIGNAIYAQSDGDECQPATEVHVFPVREVGKPDLIEKIIRERSDKKGIAVTYGGLLGIDIALAHNTEGVLLLDINPEQKKFWRAMIDTVKECPTLESFKERFTALKFRYGARQSDREDNEQYPSFLEDPKLYKRVHEWAVNGMMASTDMDVLDTGRHHKLAEILRRANEKVDVIYLSNIPHFYDDVGTTGLPPRETNFYSMVLNTGDYQRLFANQNIIAGDNAQVVQANYDPSSGNFMLQQSNLAETTPGSALRQ